jgi:hypothetical protein
MFASESAAWNICEAMAAESAIMLSGNAYVGQNIVPPALRKILQQIPTKLAPIQNESR